MITTNDSIGDRMKRYEKAYDFKLTPRSCLFIRVDGKAFHSFTKDANKPFDKHLIDSMVHAAGRTVDEMQGFKGCYLQSDECTFMLTDFDKLDTQAWFGYELNKVLSITASAFTAAFNAYYNHPKGKLAIFDARAFIVPIDDAANVFVWRQRDWERNSLQMFARSVFSHNELEGKSSPEIHDMLHERELNWADLSGVYKNGTFIFRNTESIDIICDKLGYEELMERLRLDDE